MHTYNATDLYQRFQDGWFAGIRNEKLTGYPNTLDFEPSQAWYAGYDAGRTLEAQDCRFTAKEETVKNRNFRLFLNDNYILALQED